MKKKNIFSLLMVLALLLGTVQPALAADTAATMQLSSVQGTVKVTNPSGRGLSLRSNMRLYSGYQVETLGKSYAWINLDNSKLIKLDASSKAEIRKSGKKLEVLLKSGNMYGDVSKPLGQDETLNIRTSTAIVGIRGTKFSVAQVRSAPQDSQEKAAERWITQVQVYEGTVSVRAQQETPDAPEAAPVMVTTTLTAGNQLVVDPAAERETEVFTVTPLAAEDISGSAAVELAQEPEPLQELGIDLSPETARELLERDQAEAQQRQAEAESARTGLETEAAPNIVWDGASETPSGGGSSSSSGGSGGGGGTTVPDPTPAPTPEPTPGSTYTVTFDPNGGTWDGADKTPRSVATEAGGRLAAASVPANPVLDGCTLTGWNTAADGSGTAVNPSGRTFAADATLYAQWLSTTVHVDQELADGSQAAAQQKIQELLNNAACTQVTVELDEYTIPYEGSDTQVITLYLKDTLTVPQGKELVMNCYFQVGSNDSYSDKAQEPDGRARAAGTITVNGTLTVNSGLSLCTGTGVGVSSIVIGSTGTLVDSTTGACEIIGDVDNRGTLQIAGDWQAKGSSTTVTFTNSGTIKNGGTISNLMNCTFTNTGAIEGGSIANSSNFFNESGGTLNIGGAFSNDSIFINSGTVTTAPGAKITNNASFELNAGSQVAIDATFENSGIVIITGDSSSPSVFSSNSTSSSGGVSNQEIGTIEINAFGRFENNDSAGGFKNAGSITIYSGGTLTNNGAFTNTGTLANNGTFTNSGNFTDKGDFVNNSTMTNAKSIKLENGLQNVGTLINQSGAELIAEPDASGGGAPMLCAINNESGARMENHGILTLSNCELNNSGTFSNETGGVFTTNSTVFNSGTGTITNNGTYYGDAVDNGGTIDGANAEQMNAGNPRP